MIKSLAIGFVLTIVVMLGIGPYTISPSQPVSFLIAWAVLSTVVWVYEGSD